MSRISAFFCVLLLFSSYSALGTAQTASQNDSVQTRPQLRGIQYVATTDSSARPLPFLAGISVSGDVAGAVMAVVSPYGQYEAACRFNLKGCYFPVFEAGWGLSDHTDETTSIHYKTGAPYFRIGCDYNFARDKHSGNRILGGLRYGFTSYDYDMDGPDIIDPVWGTATPFHYKGLRGTTHWMEVSFGLEAKIWSIFHLGWTLRYRMRLSDSAAEQGKAWYVPGFGRNDGSALSGTFNIVFDIQ